MPWWKYKKNTQQKLNVIGANYQHQEIYKESATHPINTAEQVSTELKEGKAYLASYSKNTQNILIKNVFLAYYIGEKRQDYLMPIVVFQGDNDFYAYVPAITDEWSSN